MIVVFDLDGTLVDSARDIATAANALVVSLGGRSLDLDAVTQMIGDGAGVLVQRALRESGLDPNTPNALARFLEFYDQHLTDNTVPYPGTRETLSILARRATLAVLTNKPAAHSERLLEALGLRSFFATVIGGDGASKKPDPAGMLSLMARTAGETAVLVGDSPIDWQTAQAAGCGFVWARYGFGAARFEGAAPKTPYVIDRPQDLVAIADGLAVVEQGR